MEMKVSEFKITFIVGPARSGTTFLASSLLADDMIYFDEPNLIWRHFTGHHKTEELDARNATNKIKIYIRNYFFSRAAKSGKSIIIEKTPTNCLRLNFISAIFPEARYIFIERDLSDVAKSATRKWINEDDVNTKKLFGHNVNHKTRFFSQKTRAALGIPVLDFLSYLPRALSEVGFLFFGRRRRVWGPRYRGIFQDIKTMAIYDVCYKQAAVCQGKVNSFKAKLPASAYLEMSYDEFVNETEDKVLELRKFIRCDGTKAQY